MGASSTSICTFNDAPNRLPVAFLMAALMECLQDEPEALKHFNSLPQGHRNYFTKWIETAKTEPTKTKRIALVIKTMVRKMDFGAMLREERDERKMLGK